MQESKYVSVTNIAGVSPTRPEIERGTVLIDASVVGLETEPTHVDVSDGSSVWTQTISGRRIRVTIPTATYIGPMIPEGTSGYLLSFPQDDIPGCRLDVWSVIIGQNGRPERQADGGFRRSMTLAVNGAPANAVVPPVPPL